MFILQAVNIDERIGYPDHILNDTRLNDYYKRVSLYRVRPIEPRHEISNNLTFGQV